VGTGKNLPVPPQQIQPGLDGDLLKQLAANAGMSTEPPVRSSPDYCRISSTN